MGVIIESATTVDDLFRGERRFKVPSFQRNYSWKPDQLKAFWEDLNNRLGNSHFLGPMTWRKTNNEYFIIDGQQRITTLQILFAVMRDFCLSHLDNPKILVEMEGGPNVERNLYEEIQKKIYTEGGNFFFEGNHYLHRFLKTYVLRAPRNSSEAPTPTFKDFLETDTGSKRNFKQVLIAINYFSDELLSRHNTNSTEATTQFLKDIFKTCKLLEVFPIEVREESEAFVLFESLNDRGLFLAPSDLLKSHLMEQAWQHEQDQGAQRVLQVWERASEFAGAPMVEVLMYMLLTKQSNVDVKRVFQSFKDRVQTEGYQSVLDDVLRHCRLHGVLVNDESAIRELGFDTSNYNRLLRGLQFIGFNKRLRTVRILLLAILNFDCEIHEKVMMTRALESLVYRWHLMGKHKQDFKNHMSRLAQLLTTSEAGARSALANQVTEELVNLIPSDSDFREYLLGLAEPHADIVKALLHRIEATYDVDEVDPLADSIQLEHIAPQTATDEWVHDLGLDAVEDEEARAASYEGLVQMWGNTTLLGETLNKQGQQSSWQRKLEGFPRPRGAAFPGYRGSYVKITQDLNELNTERWTPELIRDRTLWLYSAAAAIWGEGGQEYAGPYPAFSQWRVSNDLIGWQKSLREREERQQEQEAG